MQKKLWPLLLTFLFALVLFVPMAKAEAEPGTGGIAVSNPLVSMTEKRDIKVTVDFGYIPDPAKLEWSFGGKKLEDWKKWDAEKKSYSGGSYITFKEEPSIKDGKVTAVLSFDLLYGTEDLSPRSLRTLYPALIKEYDLQVKDADKGTVLTEKMKLNVYDEYLKWEEIKPEIDKIMKETKKGRYVSYEPLGMSAEGRPVHFVVLAKDKSSVDFYLKEISKRKIDNPAEMKKLLKEGKLKGYKVPLWFNNIHPDEAPGVDSITELFRIFATEDETKFKTTNKDGKEEEVTLNIEDTLDDVIFLFNFTQNPDGREYNTRQNVNGFDLNRDNTYQTQVETQNLSRGLSKWLPISLIDFHGFYKEFVIEPCTPPHNPNYEFDLLMDGMIDQAHAMGKAGIANTKYDSYLIPLLGWKDKFDDATPSYTSTYSMFHGALGHTVEIPDLNGESYKALVNAGLAAAKYTSDEKDRLFNNQLEFYERGVNGEDNRAVDKWLINANGDVIGRDRGKNANFFPEYYVIPASGPLQKNVLEAHKMADYLLRNGIKLEKLTKAVKVGDKVYPAGSYVVNMHQAKRGFANALLFDGIDVSDWNEMYAEIVISFHDLRGFTRDEVRKAGVFAGKTKSVKSVKVPKTVIKGNGKLVLKNVNNDTIMAVNSLLAKNKEVLKAQQSGSGIQIGDYIVNASDLKQIKSSYYLETAPYAKTVKTIKLKQLKVANAGSKTSNYVLKQLGFELVDDPAKADVIVDDSGAAANKDLIKSGKPYIGLGYSSLNFVKSAGLLNGFDFATTTGSRASHEGLLAAEVDTKNIINSGYNQNEKLYIATGSMITSVPEKSQILSKISSRDGFFLSGWWPGHEKLRGQTMAFKSGSITLFANDLVHKAHTQYSYRMLANAIYASQEK